VTTGLFMVMVQYIQALPVVYKTLFTIPNLVLINVMACRVFRHLKLGDFVDASTINHPGIPFSVGVDHSGDRKTSDISSGRRPSTNEDSPKTTMVILVERITEQHQDGSERKDDEKEHE